MVVVRVVDDGGVEDGGVDGEGIASGSGGRSQDKRRGGASSLWSSEVGCVVGVDSVDDGSVWVVVAVDNG